MTEQGANADQTATERDRTLEPVPVAEAAARLGLSTDAVRMRIRRGTIDSAEIDGRRMVLLPRSDPDPTRPNADRTPTEPAANATDRCADAEHDRGEPETERRSDATELVEHLRSEVAYLRGALDAEIEARRRADHLLAGMIEERRQLAAKVEALTAGTDRTPTERDRDTDRTRPNNEDAPVAAQEAPQRAEPDDAAPEPSRSLWGRLRALFGSG